MSLGYRRGTGSGVMAISKMENALRLIRYGGYTKPFADIILS